MSTRHSVIDDIDILIERLRTGGCEQLANILDHRLHRVAWTTGTELRDELKRVLDEAELPDDLQLKERVQKIRQAL